MYDISTIKKCFDDSYGTSDDVRKIGLFSIIPFVLFILTIKQYNQDASAVLFAKAMYIYLGTVFLSLSLLISSSCLFSKKHNSNKYKKIKYIFFFSSLCFFCIALSPVFLTACIGGYVGKFYKIEPLFENIIVVVIGVGLYFVAYIFSLEYVVFYTNWGRCILFSVVLFIIAKAIFIFLEKRLVDGDYNKKYMFHIKEKNCNH